jgi:excisionase family DNA binding protein
VTEKPEQEILNIDEAAELLGVSVKTFNKVLHSESIPGRKIGREWKFSRRALIDWIGNGRSDRFYEIAPAPNGRGGARPDVRTRDEEDPDDGPPGTRRTSGWRLKMD